jgi:hypothetical protein
MRYLRAVLMLSLAGGLLTCGESIDPTGPGWLNVVLDSPNLDDGGVMFTVQGGPIDSVRSSLPDVFDDRVSATQWRMIVIGDVPSAVIAQVWVPDADAASRYSATVEQAASATTFGQRSTGTYALRVEP